MKPSEPKLIVGVSACWMHDDESRQLYNGRPLLYLEQSMGAWILSDRRALPFMIPAATDRQQFQADASRYAEAIDGLVLQGGVDVAPQTYGEQPIRPEWAGDAVRDDYELALIEACLKRDVPILAICRGHQLLNVALGGTLYQDIETQIGAAVQHRDDERYDDNTHAVEFVEGSALGSRYAVSTGMVNSVHHQAVNAVGSNLRVEAISPDDGLVEALRYVGDRYAVGVQWHPEFQRPQQSHLLSPMVLLNEFVSAVARRVQGELT